MEKLGLLEQKRGAFAPVALFAYKRPEHLRRTIEALKQNPEFFDSPIYIFFDGARKQEECLAIKKTREIARLLLPAHAIFIERDLNLGLRRSIIEGVTQITHDFGRVIVVEDDLVVAEHFLRFMNSALERYQNEPSVLQISGHMFSVQLAARTGAIFLPFTTTWGWATWQRSWQAFGADDAVERLLKSDRKTRTRFDLDGAYPYFQMLRRQQRGEVDSWGILWYASVFARNGLTLYPSQSLVMNAGFDGTGTNCSYDRKDNQHRLDMNTDYPKDWPVSVSVDFDSFKRIKGYLSRRTSSFGRLLRKLQSFLGPSDN